MMEGIMATEKQIEVTIENFEPMRVASFYGFGPSPENIAMEKLIAWAKPKGYLKSPGEHRIFGFNNPNPSQGTPNYGYEFWITVGDDVEPEGDIRIHQFNGGLYAVTRCTDAGPEGKGITETWMNLFRWIQGSRYTIAAHQSLEEHIGEFPLPLEKMVLDICMPVSE